MDAPSPRGAARASGGRGPGLGPVPGPAPSRRSLRGLDWFIFFLADVQTGFGPFISVYLTSEHWTQVDIGLVLTVGGLTALAGQMPGGALVDAARSERFVAGVSIAVIGVSALALAVWTIFPVVLAAQILHSLGSCVLGPAIAAISLGLVGYHGIGERLGRNARFASIGNGIAAAGMGACGYLISDRAVFFITVALCLPALFALSCIREEEINPERAHGGRPAPHPGAPWEALFELLRNKALIVFAACVVLFQLANAPMLSLMSSVVTMRSSQWATVLVAACIVVPQIVVACFSPWIGRKAHAWGRRPLLLIGFAALPLRGMLFALTSDPYVLVAVQVLDGVSAAVLAVMVPLIIADATRGSGHFNLAQGIVGTAVGLGASFSTTLAGYVSDHCGSGCAFVSMSATAAAGLLLALALMPETRPQDE